MVQLMEVLRSWGTTSVRMAASGRYLATRLAVRPLLAYTTISPACTPTRAVVRPQAVGVLHVGLSGSPVQPGDLRCKQGRVQRHASRPARSAHVERSTNPGCMRSLGGAAVQLAQQGGPRAEQAATNRARHAWILVAARTAVDAMLSSLDRRGGVTTPGLRSPGDMGTLPKLGGRASLGSCPWLPGLLLPCTPQAAHLSSRVLGLAWRWGRAGAAGMGSGLQMVPSGQRWCPGAAPARDSSSQAHPGGGEGCRALPAGDG